MNHEQFHTPPLDIVKLVQAIIPKTELGEVQAQLLFLPGQYVFIFKEQEKTHCKFLSPTDVAQAFADTAIDSGWLSSPTIRWGHGSSGEWVVQYYQPQRYQIQLFDTQLLKVPLPAFIFAGCQTRYWIWASKTKQFDFDTCLYAAPLPNVYPDGAICFGELHPPSCTASKMALAWEAFWNSTFSDDLVKDKSKRHSQDVRAQLVDVANRKRYPVNDLIPLRNSNNLDSILKQITK